MKTVLVSILIALLIVSNSAPIKEQKKEVNVDTILAKCDQNLDKAYYINKVADQQQKEKMIELHRKVQKLEEEKKKLEIILVKNKHELNISPELGTDNDTLTQIENIP